MERIQWKRNTMAPSSDKFLSVMDVREVKKAKAFHESFPQYSITPLVSLKNLASYIGVDALFVKDESYRFGLNAFKVLGGSYAMAKYVAQQTGKPVEDGVTLMISPNIMFTWWYIFLISVQRSPSPTILACCCKLEYCPPGISC